MSSNILEPVVETYTVRRLLPEDAPGVNECVREIYGESYVHPELYDPEQLLRLNATGELVSVVALDRQDRVVGHYALERPGLPPIAEGGAAMVLPACRHHQLMERMRELLEAEAVRLELAGLFGHAVTNHIFTQRSDEHFGEHACAVSLGWSPRTFHNLPEPLPQRMSEILYFKFLRAPRATRVFLPARHQAICAEIYAQLSVAVEFAPPAPAAEQGTLQVDYRSDLQRAVIRVQRVGCDTVRQVGKTLETLIPAGVEAVFVELPAAQPGTPETSEALAEQGLFFSGLGPCFAADGDALRLQWLRDPIDPSLLQIVSPFAQQLLTFAMQDRARVG